MSKKLLAIALPPRPVVSVTPADAFVSAGQPALIEAPPAPPKEPVKRLTIDLPAGMHKRFKAAVAAGDRDMREVCLSLIQGYLDGK